MRIGLISDIHGDIDALQAALTLLEAQGIDKILCAGDLVEKGIQGDAVVRVIKERAIPCVMGNHDFIAADNQRWREKNFDLGHPAVRSRILSESTLNYLATLPETLRMTIEGQRILIAHGAPWSIITYVYPFSSSDLLERVAREADAEFVIIGHTHIPTQVQINGTHILNPGSVCRNIIDRGSHTCAILTLPNFLFEVFEIDSGRYVRPHPQSE